MRQVGILASMPAKRPFPSERRRRERFVEPQQYPAGDVYAAGGAERQRKIAGRRPQECAEM
jgi:hypothetical protein